MRQFALAILLGLWSGLFVGCLAEDCIPFLLSLMPQARCWSSLLHPMHCVNLEHSTHSVGIVECLVTLVVRTIMFKVQERIHKAATGAGCDGFHPRVPFAVRPIEGLCSSLTKVSDQARICELPEQAKHGELPDGNVFNLCATRSVPRFASPASFTE